MGAVDATEIQKKLEQLIDIQLQLEKILKQDIEYFKSNDLPSIEKSNRLKEELNQLISTCLNDFHINQALSSFPGNYIERIEQYCSKIKDTKFRNTLEQLIAQEKTLLESVYSQVQINTLIINSNLEFSKHLI